MGKLPYIPLYIGDWEQDVNSISLEAEGALLKLVFKLWKSDTKGEMEIGFNSLSLLLKKAQDQTLKIMQELQKNDVLVIEFLESDTVKIKSRRMVKALEQSKVNSENGKKGGRGKKRNESEMKAKQKRNTEYEYEIECIISYLNKKASVNFKFDAEKNQKVIRARLSEKFTIADFETVIDYRVMTWGKDPKMKEFLRPETLFGSKFESYLQAANQANKPQERALVR